MSNENTLVDQVREKCRQDLQATVVEVIDLSAGHGAACHGGAKLQILVVSPQFEGVPTLARHRLVHACLESFLASQQIHALTLQTYTAEQYAAKSSSLTE